MKWPARRGGHRPEPLALLLPDPLGAQIDELLRQDRLAHAVRLVRQRTDADFLTATRAVKHRLPPTAP